MQDSMYLRTRLRIKPLLQKSYSLQRAKLNLGIEIIQGTCGKCHKRELQARGSPKEKEMASTCRAGEGFMQEQVSELYLGEWIE